VGPDLIQRGLEVIQNDPVAEALEDEREFQNGWTPVGKSAALNT
jgi:hypothetical protein